ncbi:MAG TPA: hypothetical protein VHZ26_09080 [Caulobacteraceae bacterium]|nr:hypothetical protein [Caulobacteraceae bacterium]
MGDVIAYPTKRRRPYRNPRLRPSELPEGVIRLMPRGPTQSIATSGPVAMRLLEAILSDMTPDQRDRIEADLHRKAAREPDSFALERACLLMAILPVRQPAE